MSALGRAAPLVSFVVTAHDAERTLGLAIEALRNQRVGGWRREIIVVDDRSTDRTRDVAQSLAASDSTMLVVSVTVPPLRNVTARQAALDAGVRAAHGERVLIVDADAVPAPSWATRMLSALDTADLVGSSLVFWPRDTTFAPRVLAALQTVDAAHYLSFCAAMSGLGLPAGVCLGGAGFRRTLFDTVGGFSALGFTLVEDLAFARAAHSVGARVRIAWDIPVPVHAVSTPRELVARARRVSAHGGASWLAAALGIWSATLVVIAIGVAAGSLPWWLLIARIAAGLMWSGWHVARTHSCWALPAVVLYEPVAMAVALLVASSPSRAARVYWGGIEYVRRRGSWVRVEPTAAR